jgi:maltose O-acetyltransferase
MKRRRCSPARSTTATILGWRRSGRHALFGPGVHFYTATHPLSGVQRRTGLEAGAPVSIADDVWAGGGAIACHGVTIGSSAVIGAGSVATRNVRLGVFAIGNPCRVLRDMADEDAP